MTDRAPFTVTLDETRRNLRVTLCGYWDLATTRAYVAELERHVAKLDHSGGATYWLIDVRDFAVQATAITEIVGHALPSLVTEDAIVAVATPNILASLQAQRIAGHEQSRFNTVAEAEAWLAKMRDAT